MRNFKKLYGIFTLLVTASFLFFSCGSPEEDAAEAVNVSVSASTVLVGQTVSFTANSNLSGNVTAQSQFFVNGTAIEGNTFSPTTENPENKVYAVYNGIQSNTATFASYEDEPEPASFTQKVLVEDYTGTWCGYCPRMVTILNYLTDYSDRIVPVAIHCPGAPEDPWTYDLALTMANPSNYNVQGRPDGRYNRIHPLDMKMFSQSCPKNPEEYYPQADEFLNQTASLGLAINSSLSGNDLNMKIKVGFATDSVPEARLVVYLLEDGLIYEQANYYSGGNYDCDPAFDYKNLPDPIPNFNQEHVLLKSYTDVFGDEIPQNQISNGGVWERDFNVPLPSNVTNADNLSIVAFVLGNGNQVSNRGVINVQSAKVGENKAFD